MSNPKDLQARQAYRQARVQINAWGDALFDALIWPVVAGIVLMTVLSWSPWARDDSDQVGWMSSRSAMIIRTDHLTGCQYLKDPEGGLTPRLDLDGQQLCKP